jgi:hypothetical protein
MAKNRGSIGINIFASTKLARERIKDLAKDIRKFRDGVESFGTNNPISKMLGGVEKMAKTSFGKLSKNPFVGEVAKEALKVTEKIGAATRNVWGKAVEDVVATYTGAKIKIAHIQSNVQRLGRETKAVFGRAIGQRMRKNLRGVSTAMTGVIASARRLTPTWSSAAAMFRNAATAATRFARSLIGVQRQASKTKKSGSGLSSMLGKLKKSMLAKGAAFGAGFLTFNGVINVVKRSVSRLIDSLLTAKTELSDLVFASRQIGSSAKDVSGLLFAANDIPRGQLESGLFALSRRIADPEGEGRGLHRILKAMNVEIAHLAKMDPAKQFIELADVYDRLENSSDRQLFKFEAMGDMGRQLAVLWDQGTAALRAAGDEVERKRIAPSPEDEQAVLKMGLAWNQTVETLKGLVRGLVIDLAPALKVALEKIQTWAEKWREMRKEGNKFFPTVVKWLSFAVSLVELMFTRLKITLKFLADLKPENLGAIVGALGADIDNATRAIEKFNRAANDGNGTLLSSFREFFAELETEMENFQHELDEEFERRKPKPDANPILGNLEAIEDLDSFIKELQKTFVEENLLSNVSPERRRYAELLSQIANKEDENIQKRMSLIERWFSLFEKERRNREIDERLIQEAKDAEERASRLFDDFRDPIKTFEQQVAELAGLQSAGLIDDSLFDKAFAKLESDFINSELGNAGSISTQAVGALTAGSREAFSAINRSRRESVAERQRMMMVHELKKQTKAIKDSGKSTVEIAIAEIAA